MSLSSYVLALSCNNRPGIVAAVSTYLFEAGCNIAEASQFDDTLSDRFFMRVVFDTEAGDIRALRNGFHAVAERFGMEWRMRDRSERRKVMLMVSKFDHCLVDLLYRNRIGELPMDVTAVVSNHPRSTYTHIEFTDTSFHYMPVDKTNKRAQEEALMRLVETTGTEVVVLARYMQVLSNELTAALSGRCINIHHSFLPGFKGANPYRQAHSRGVKLIGATAHFVTSDLDEGPIIEQNVRRVDHTMDVPELIAMGQEQESRTLTEAVRLFAEHRVLLDGSRTVIFS